MVDCTIMRGFNMYFASSFARIWKHMYLQCCFNPQFSFSKYCTNPKSITLIGQQTASIFSTLGIQFLALFPELTRTCCICPITCPILQLWVSLLVEQGV